MPSTRPHVESAKPQPTAKPANRLAAARPSEGHSSAGIAAPARRLGRGLNSLLGTPVKVEIPDSTPPETQTATPMVAGPRPAEPARRADKPAVTTRSDHPAATGGGASIDRDDEHAGARIVMIAVDKIVPNRHQPRRSFDEASLAELAASIRAAGVVQPVLVRRSGGQAGTPGTFATGGSSSYELVAGERRWRASKLAGLKEVPAVVAELTEEQAAEWALIENVQRADLQPLEQAHAVKRLCEQFSLTHAQAGEKLGLDRSTITNLVRLTELEPEIQTLIENKELSAGHGKALLACAGGKQRVNLAKKCAADGWSVKRLAAAISLALSGKPVAGEDAAAHPTSASRAKSALAAAGLLDLEKQLADHLGTKVQIRLKRGGKSGTVVVKFYDLDHFDGLMGKMGFVMR